MMYVKSNHYAVHLIQYCDKLYLSKTGREKKYLWFLESLLNEYGGLKVGMVS